MMKIKSEASDKPVPVVGKLFEVALLSGGYDA